MKSVMFDTLSFSGEEWANVTAQLGCVLQDSL